MIAILCLALLLPAGTQEGEDLQDLGASIPSAMADWKVPGVSVAVVKGEEVVLLQGFGMRDPARLLPVTHRTLFPIGSATKPFTTALLATLVDEGKLRWDEPVVTYMPDLRLWDAGTTRRITPRDLVTHRSGLPRHDLVWYNSPVSRAGLVERLRWLEPSADLRERFQYQNLMFVAAGHLAERVAGKPWEDLVRERLLTPLGMARTVFTIEDMERSDDHAVGHAERGREAIPVPFRRLTAAGPAGGIDSSAEEMARWLLFHLNGGKRLLRDAQIREMHRPQMLVPQPPVDPEICMLGYGLGWFAESYRGHARVQHGGAIDGFSAAMSILPDDGIGIVVLANLTATPLPEIVVRTALDRLLGLDPIDWNARFLARRGAVGRATGRAEERAPEARKEGTSPAHPLDEYAGEYEHPAYGEVVVERAGEGLRASFHGLPMRLTHWHYEFFRAYPDDPTLAERRLLLEFRTNVRGEVDRLAAPFEPEVSDIVFTRKPPARLSDPAFLRGLAGQYAVVNLPDLVLTVALRGERTLVLTQPGEPERVLAPDRGTGFRIEGLSGYAIRFLLDPEGRATGFLALQPNGVFEARRRE